VTGEEQDSAAGTVEKRKGHKTQRRKDAGKNCCWVATAARIFGVLLESAGPESPGVQGEAPAEPSQSGSAPTFAPLQCNPVKSFHPEKILLGRELSRRDAEAQRGEEPRKTWPGAVHFRPVRPPSAPLRLCARFIPPSRLRLRWSVARLHPCRRRKARPVSRGGGWCEGEISPGNSGSLYFLLNKRVRAVFKGVVELLVCCVSWKAERPCFQRERYSSS
jgi:hypothetical protein